MKKLIQFTGLLICLANLNHQLSAAFAQGTAFTYQGRLNSGGGPANGFYDLQFSLYNVNTNGVIFAGPLTNSATGVSNGLFTVTLDFGPGIFTGPGYWLDISVRTNGGGAFTELSPRQPLLPTPYAVMANSASNLLGTLPAAQLAGTIPASALSGTYNQPVTFNNGQDQFDGNFFGSFFGSTFQGGTFTGQFMGDGSGLINLNPAHIGSGQIAFLNSNQVFTAQNVFMQPVGFGQPNPNPLYQIDVLGSQANQRIMTANNVAGSTLELRNLLNSPNEALGAINFNNAGNSLPGQIAYIQPNPANPTLDDLQFRVGGYGAFTIQGDTRGTASANIIGGYSGNSISQINDAGNTIAGGGVQGAINLISSNTSGAYIGTGSGNQIGSLDNNTVIAGGQNMSIGDSSPGTFIGAGYGNIVGFYSGYSAICAGLNEAIGTNSGGSFIGAGAYHSIQFSSAYSVIVGGYNHYIGTNAPYAFIGGGLTHQIGALSANAVIVGGENNSIGYNTSHAFIGAGAGNAIGFYSGFSAIPGGINNTIETNAGNSLIGDGFGNRIQSGATASVIGGGNNNTIGTNAPFSVIGGGNGNIIQTNAGYSFIGAGYQNTIQTNVGYGFIGAGYQNRIGSGASDTFIGAGFANTIGTNANNAVIGGGVGNQIGALSDHAAIAGGENNSIGYNTSHSFIGGGIGNTMGFYSGFSTIGSGINNTIETNAGDSIIGDGVGNDIQADSYDSVIGGGSGNFIQPLADHSTIAGGYNNAVQTGAWASTIGGGTNNAAGAPGSTVPGGAGNLAGGINSFAAGTQAQATNNGAFVLADDEQTNFYSTTSNQLSARFTGGVRFVTVGAGMTLDGQPILSAASGAPASGSTNYIQNQILGIQNASFQISGSALVGGAVTTSNLIANNATVSATLTTSNITASGSLTTSNLDINGGQFQVLGAGSNTLTTAFIQWTTAGNITANRTVINNPICNGDPNAILIVTHNFNPGGLASQVVWNHPLGTFYTGGQWTIYDEDLSNMVANVAFNVLIIKH